MQAEIHSALRALIRAQRFTFQNDWRARQAARQLNRSLLEPALSASTTQQEKSESIASARQVARYLVENVLQGVQKSEAEIAYALRITSQTALGDNSTIKNVTPAPSLDEIKASMNKGDTSDNSNAPRRRRRRSADKSVEENLSQAGETSVSGTSSS